MKRRSEVLLDKNGNARAKITLSCDEDVLGWELVKKYESELFGELAGAISSIVDNISADEIKKKKNRLRPVTIHVTLRRVKLKKTYLLETVSCAKGSKNLYKSRVNHIFRERDGEVFYCGVRKKTVAENVSTKSNISSQNT